VTLVAELLGRATPRPALSLALLAAWQLALLMA
jgi:hypothetical protein